MDMIIESLIKWLQTFENYNDINSSDLNDGIILAKVLNKIVPDYFDENWLYKLKENLSNDQWRLKVSNLKKIIEKVCDFYENLLALSLDVKYIPDSNLIAKDSDKNELKKLLQLVLCIAVNCENKQTYIQSITKLDLIVQKNLMEAIQQTMLNEKSRSENNTSSNFFDSISYDTNLKDLKDQLAKTYDTLRSVMMKKDDLIQQKYDLENKLQLEIDAKLNLQKDNENLNEKLKFFDQFNLGKDDLIEKNLHVNKLKNKINSLEKELLLSENQKEELQIKIDLLQNDLYEIKLTNENLLKKVKEAKLLKDELDIHRHSSDKIEKYEQKLDTYKKKIEELTDVKKQLKILEDKNRINLEKNIELEEEIKKMGLFKSQINEYKKQIQELHQQIIEKTHNFDKNEFEFNKLNEKYNVLLHEKNLLEKENYELKSQLNSNNHNIESFNLNEDNENNILLLNNLTNLNLEIKTEDVVDIKEKLIRLELENKHLKMKHDTASYEELLLAKNNYEDALQRLNELETDNRKLNKTIIELNSKLDDYCIDKNNQYNIANVSNNNIIKNININNNINQVKDLNQSVEFTVNLDEKNIYIKNLNNEVKILQKKLNEYEKIIANKNENLKEVENNYKLYKHKAKQIIDVLQPLSVASLKQVNNLPQNNISVINSDLYTMYSMYSNEQLIQELYLYKQKLNYIYNQFDKHKRICDMEIRLMTTSIHSLAFNLMRKAATERTLGTKNQTNILSNDLSNLQKQNNSHNITNNNLNLNNSLNLNTGSSQSFLTKQRQATSMRINLEKVTNS